MGGRCLHFLAPPLGALVLAATAAGGAVAADEGGPSTPALVLKARPLAEAVRRLSPAAGPALVVHPELADRRVSLFLQPGKEQEARARLAEHLGYRWAPLGEGQQLEQTAVRARQPARLREERVREARRALEERLLLCRRVLRGEAQALPQLEALDWRAVSRMSRNLDRSRMELLGYLEPAELKALVRQGAWVSRPLGSVSPEARAAALHLGQGGVDVTFPASQGRPTEAQIRDAVARDNRDLPARRVVLQLYGDPDDPGVCGSLINPLPLHDPGANRNYRTPLRYMVMHPVAPDILHVSAPLPFLERPGPDMERPELQQRLSLAGPPGATGRPSYPLRFEDVLERLALRTGHNILADSYQSTRAHYLSWGRPLVDVPLWRVLRQICYDFQYRVEVKDGWLLFRHARWPFEEECELPDALLAELDQEVAVRRGLSHDHMQALALTLSRPQFLNLRRLYPELQRHPMPYSSLRIFGTLTPLQRLAAESAEGLPAAQLSPGQLQELRVILASNRPYLGAQQLREVRLHVGTADPAQAQASPSPWMAGTGWGLPFTSTTR